MFAWRFAGWEENKYSSSWGGINLWTEMQMFNVAEKVVADHSFIRRWHHGTWHVHLNVGLNPDNPSPRLFDIHVWTSIWTLRYLISVTPRYERLYISSNWISIIRRFYMRKWYSVGRKEPHVRLRPTTEPDEMSGTQADLCGQVTESRLQTPWWMIRASSSTALDISSNTTWDWFLNDSTDLHEKAKQRT